MPSGDWSFTESAVARGADYTADELQFLKAMDRFKRETGRAFPTWREVLGVLKSLGYAKTEPPPARPQR